MFFKNETIKVKGKKEENNFFVEVNKGSVKDNEVGLQQINDMLNKMVQVCNKHMNIKDKRILCYPSDALKMLVTTHRNDVRGRLRVAG
jgi:hypothetical protein